MITPITKKPIQIHSQIAVTLYSRRILKKKEASRKECQTMIQLKDSSNSKNYSTLAKKDVAIEEHKLMHVINQHAMRIKRAILRIPSFQQMPFQT